jgi:hypothetical protein
MIGVGQGLRCGIDYLRTGEKPPTVPSIGHVCDQFGGYRRKGVAVGSTEWSCTCKKCEGKEMIIIKVIYESKKPDLIFVSEALGDAAKETVGEVLRSDYLKSDEVMRLIDEDVHSIEIRNTEKKKK